MSYTFVGINNKPQATANTIIIIIPKKAPTLIPAIAPLEDLLPETFGITDDGLMISVTVVVTVSLADVIDRLALVVTLNDASALDVALLDEVADGQPDGLVVDGNVTIIIGISKSSSVGYNHENFHTVIHKTVALLPIEKQSVPFFVVPSGQSQL